MKSKHSVKTIFISLVLSVSILTVSNCKKNNTAPDPNTETSTGSVTGNSSTGGGTTGTTMSTSGTTSSTSGTTTAGTTGNTGSTSNTSATSPKPL